MTPFLSWLLRILIVLLLIKLVVQWFSTRKVGSARGSRRGIERAGGTLVRDPQCGTYVPEARAVKEGGEYFCSTACRDAWLAAARRSASR